MLRRVPLAEESKPALSDYLQTHLDLSVSIPTKLWICIAKYFSTRTTTKDDDCGTAFNVVFTYKAPGVNSIVVDVVNFLNVTKTLRVHDVICTKNHVYLYVRKQPGANKDVLHFVDRVISDYVNGGINVPMDDEDAENGRDVHPGDSPLCYRGLYEVLVPLTVLVSKLKPKENGQYLSQNLYCEKHWMYLHNLVVSRLVDFFYYIHIARTPVNSTYGIYSVKYYASGKPLCK